jgi:hypothetical protein
MMYNISLILSYLLTNLYYLILPKTVTKIVTRKEIVKDPNGFVKGDMENLNKLIPNKVYNKGDTLADIAYQSGQQSVITLIDKHIIGRR